MEYNPQEIEKKWQKFWADNKTFRAEDHSQKPKYYVLDMFPYPSGAGLHVGHPLGYIASDIIARYKRLQGFNVLHPMGYDSFGLPAEQYAIQTGQHPAITTEKNIARYREQLDRIGFSFDWEREVRTSDPKYYKWTQWIFLQLFKSWYNPRTNKAESIDTLIAIFEKEGFGGENHDVLTGEIEKDLHAFTPEEWKKFDERKKQEILMHFRLAYLGEAYVNWCPALGTVLANDEVKDGVSERGGHPVERKLMKQWSMRITAYAQRLLDGLNEIDWSESIKEAQRNWIGKSEGCSVRFHLTHDLTPLPLSRSAGQVLPERGGDSSFMKEEDQVNEMMPEYFTTDWKKFNALINRAKEMRKKPTKAEMVLWEALRNKLSGFKFRRQHIIDRFIVDFVCLSHRLVVEADGDIHDLQVEADEERTKILNDHGFRVIRFTNEEVLNNVDKVIISIKKVISESEDENKDENIGIVNEGNEEYSYSKIPVSAFTQTSKVSIVTTTNSSGDEKNNPDTFSSSPGEEKNNPGIFSPSLGERGQGGEVIEVFTTRPDTLFGVSYLTLAPEHELVVKITTPERKEKIQAYVTWAKNRSERERQADVKNITGEFTGAYAIHPFTGEKIPVWVGDYVLAGYGTGAVMAVPAHDSRDHAFARHFGLPVKQVVETPAGFDLAKEAYEEKSGKVINSDFLNGLEVKEAIKKCIEEIEKNNYGKGKINYRLRDAVFGRQRYWGEPIPIYYKDEIPYPVEESDLPVVLPEVDKYLPTEDGEPPLARAKNWYYIPGISSPSLGERGLGGEVERTTMPGWAGSSWYFLRYMDPHNENRFAAKEKLEYWNGIDLYIGGAEHATGHLLYFRFWTKFLKDLGHISIEEPAKKLINQGMIQGVSQFIIRYKAPRKLEPKVDHSVKYTTNSFPLLNLKAKLVEWFTLNEKSHFVKEINLYWPKSFDIYYDFDYYNTYQELLEKEHAFIKDLYVPVDVVINGYIDVKKFIESEKFKGENPVFISLGGIYYEGKIFSSEDYFGSQEIKIKTRSEIEKMSKSKWNVVNPDDLCGKYGADTLRCYEMFLGPLTDHKPWDTKGIEGTFRFLKKLWRLFENLDTNNYSDSLSSGDSQNTSGISSPSPRENLSRTAGEGPGGEVIAELKSLHKCIKRVQEDLDRYSFNTVVSTLMICVNELTDLKCRNKAILEQLVILVSPYAPHIAEELWQKLGHTTSVTFAEWPQADESYLVEDHFNYPVQFNGKLRFSIELSASLSAAEVEKEVLALAQTQKYLEGKTPKKVIVVPKRIVNIVV